jgi:hypothetical protein
VRSTDDIKLMTRSIDGATTTCIAMPHRHGAKHRFRATDSEYTVGLIVEVLMPTCFAVVFRILWGSLTVPVIMSGSAFDGGDVHASVGFIPWWSTSDPGAARTITDGVFDASSSSGLHFAFHAEDTTADLRVGTRVGQCHPCLAGDTVALSVSRLVTNEAAGTATVRGNGYGQVAMPQVQFTITADSFVIPDTGEQTMTVSSPFTFSGVVLVPGQTMSRNRANSSASRSKAQAP